MGQERPGDITGGVSLLVIVFLKVSFVYLLFGVAFALLIPPWETPDAPSHYLYVRHIFITKRLPLPSDVNLGLPYPATLYEWHHPPLYYLTQALFLRIINTDPDCLSLEFPALNKGFSFNKPSPRYTVSDWPWWTTAVNRTVAKLRIANLLICGWPTLLVAGWTGWRLTKKAQFGAMLALLVGLLPQLLFVHVSVENDGMAILWATGVWSILLLTSSNPSMLRWYHVAGVGIMSGLGLLTKLTFFPTTLIAAVWAIWCMWHTKSKVAFIAFLVPLGLCLTTYAIIGWEHWRALYSYVTQPVVRSELAHNWLRFIYLASDSFWGRFGWMNVSVLPSVSPLISLAVGAGFLWAGYNLATGRYPQGLGNLRSVLGWACAGLLGQLLFFFRTFLPIFQPQGRFLFPTLLPLWLVILLTLWPKLNGRWRSLLLLACWVSFDLLSIIRLIVVYWQG
jgi:hypothetical protein